MISNILVSIVMPAHNSERYISDAIRSVIAQTYKRWELLVIDDCSTDCTAEIAKSLVNADKRINYIRNDRNLGVALSRNRGFEAAHGDRIALLDSDDIWHSDKLEKQLAIAEKTGSDIVYCSYSIMDENSKKISDFIVPERVSYDELLRESVISCSTAMLSRSIIDTELFSNEYYHEDYAYWLRLLRKGYTAAAATEVLTDYRVVNGSRSHNKLKSAKERWLIYRKAEHLSLRRSVSVFCSYAIRGTVKYGRMHK